MTIRYRSARVRLRLAILRNALRAWSRTRAQSLPGSLRVLDLGIEHGDAGGLARRVLGERGHITGVDLWEPHVHAALASGVYDEADVMDALHAAQRAGRMPGRDAHHVVIASELIEHLAAGDGRELLARLCSEPLLAPGGLAIVTAPIGWMPQGAIDGNPHEEHRSAWFPHDLERLGFVTLALLPEHHLFVSAYTTAEVQWRA